MHLRIRNTSETYPNGLRALADVSLPVPRGRFGLLGPNGAEKSMLMRMIATLQDRRPRGRWRTLEPARTGH